MYETRSQESNVEKINSDERKERNEQETQCNKRTVRKLLCEGGKKKYESTFDDSASMVGSEWRWILMSPPNLTLIQLFAVMRQMVRH